MDPSTGRTFILLGGFVGARPVSFGVPPEAGERVTEVARGLVVLERFSELLQRHDGANRYS